MKISIITICYNNERDIRPTLESVVNQTYHDIDYVIVDGASRDRTLEIVNEYKEGISVIISEADKGIYDAINKGIRHATGDVIGLIHAGDRLYSNQTISIIANFFEENDIDISYGHSKIVDKNSATVRINKSPVFKRSLAKWGWMPSHQSIYIRRELFEKYGYYNLDFHPYSDYDFFLRYFYFNQPRIKRLDEYIVKFFMGGISTSNNIRNFRSQSLHKRCWIHNGEQPPFYLVIMKLLRKVKQVGMAKLNIE